MEVIGKLRMVLPESRGESARGPWVRGGFVIDLIDSSFPRSIAFSTWGEDMLATLKSIRMGDTIQVTFEIESREYNGRWYTDCRCRNIGAFVSNLNGGNNPVSAQNGQSAQQPTMQSTPYQQPNNIASNPTPVSAQQVGTGGNIEQETMMEDDPENDLPF